MPPAKSAYPPSDAIKPLAVKEEQFDYGFIGKLQSLKYEYRPDIRDRASLERNFRGKFEALNRVHLSDGEFTRLLDEIVIPDGYTAARTLRERNAFTQQGPCSSTCDAGVGKSAAMAVPMAVSQHFMVWTCHAHLLSNWFLYYLLQEIKPIGLPFFKELRLAIPTSPEQQRIANCLSALDDHITAAAQELEAIKIHKKGLMQQLFPSAEAEAV